MATVCLSAPTHLLTSVSLGIRQSALPDAAAKRQPLAAVDKVLDRVWGSRHVAFSGGGHSSARDDLSDRQTAPLSSQSSERKSMSHGVLFPQIRLGLWMGYVVLILGKT